MRMRTASDGFLEWAQVQRPHLLPGSALLTLRGRGEGWAGRRGGVTAARVRGRELRGGAAAEAWVERF